MRAFNWHDCASDAAFLCGVADDRITEALRGANLTPSEICSILDNADAALATAHRNLTQARAHAVELRMMMED